MRTAGVSYGVPSSVSAKSRCSYPTLRNALLSRESYKLNKNPEWRYCRTSRGEPYDVAGARRSYSVATEVINDNEMRRHNDYKRKHTVEHMSQATQ